MSARPGLVGLALGLGLLAGCATAPRRPADLEAGYAMIQKDPNRGDGYVELARRYLQRGDNLRARQYLTLAETRPVKDPDGLFRLGVVISVRAGQHDEAIRRCRRQLEQAEDAQVRRLLSTLLESAGRWDEAEQERKLVLLEHPDDPHETLEMARFYARARIAGGPDRAAALYRRCIELAPDGKDAPQARAALRLLDLSAGTAGALTPVPLSSRDAPLISAGAPREVN